MLSFDELSTAALALPLDQRIELAQELWASIHANGQPLTPAEEAIFDEADRRDAEIESGAVKEIPLDEAFEQIRASLRCK